MNNISKSARGRGGGGGRGRGRRREIMEKREPQRQREREEFKIEGREGGLIKAGDHPMEPMPGPRPAHFLELGHGPRPQDLQ